jgi:hypothetical protein
MSMEPAAGFWTTLAELYRDLRYFGCMNSGGDRRCAGSRNVLYGGTGKSRQ